MQPELPGIGPPPRPASEETGKVARVILDTPVFHLATPFDYRIPPNIAGVVPGVRVKVRIAGQKATGYVVKVLDHSEHPGRLLPVEELISPLPVLTPEVLALCESVAAAYAGSLSDVLRLAIPARRAGVEANLSGTLLHHILNPQLIPAPEPSEWVLQLRRSQRDSEPSQPRDGAEMPLPLPLADPTTSDSSEVELPDWTNYTGGAALLRHLENGESPRAVWTAMPGVYGVQSVPKWMIELRSAVARTLLSGRRALLIVPTTSEAEMLGEVMEPLGSTVLLHAELAPTARARAFLTVLGGGADIVVGTRSAAFAPVPNLGLTVLWNPDDDSLQERHAPGPHALGVVLRRRDCSILVGSYSMSVALAQLIDHQWAADLAPVRDVLRGRAPRIHGDPADMYGDTRRIPSAAFTMLRRGLESGPVLIHVPLSGHLRSVRCATCGHAARCGHCGGPLQLVSERTRCRWCERPQRFTCPSCGGTTVRAHTVGSERTTEEFGRAFPGIPITLSNARAGVTERVGSEPRLVIATPGAEPIAEGGYQAALILDAAMATARPELAASDVTLARWMNALALLKGADDGGEAMILGGAEPSIFQACVRWDGRLRAATELAERADLHLPPVWKVARIEGESADLREVERSLRSTLIDAGVEILGPTPTSLLVRVPSGAASDLSEALRALQSERSARKLPALSIRIDPIDL